MNPRFETGDERYHWTNTTFFIGEGRILPGLGVEYRIWRPACGEQRLSIAAERAAIF